MNSIIQWLVGKQLKPILANWKTTLVGVGLSIPFFVTALQDVGGVIQKLVDIASGTSTDIDGVIVALKAAAAAAGAGFVLARDANKSSENSHVN